MLKQVRQNIVNHLWAHYRSNSTPIKKVEECLNRIGLVTPTLDHFAIIDLPGPHTGIPYLHDVFSCLGYRLRGRDYLADKQNDFLWMAETDAEEQDAVHVLPQVVVADFRLEEMPPNVRTIIDQYARQAPAAPQKIIQKLAHQASLGETEAANQLTDLVIHYFSGRDWPLPTIKEFHTVQEFNELLAWVLIFGRRPNHFTLSIHLLNHFTDLQDFHRFIEKETDLCLNAEGGIIKGGKKTGIAQSSTLGQPLTITIADGNISLPTEFVEFVWRYPLNVPLRQPVLWKDFFTGFIAKHADHVIESLYAEK